MNTPTNYPRAMGITLLLGTFCACLFVAALSLTTITPQARAAQTPAEKAFAKWKAAQEAVAAAKAKLADAQKALQNAMTAVAKSGEKATAAQEAALEKGRAAVAEAEAALREAEKEELAARVALENEIAELPDGPLKDRLKRERNFPTLVIGNGLYRVNFNTPSGQLTVNLPDDLRAGDTISGTVFTEPKGNTAEEKAKNQSVLNGYVFDLDGTKVPSESPMFTWTPTMPPAGSPPRYLIKIVEAFGRPYDQTPGTGAWIFPNPGTQATTPSGAVITPDPKTTPAFNIPLLGQAGRPVVITGPFDGNSSNTTINAVSPRSRVPASEKPLESFAARLIAESPRKAVFQVPTNVTGSIEITVKDGDKQTTGNHRNVGVNLSAPKTNLLKGERTTLTVRVEGLAGIKEPVPLTLESTGVINMEGGTYQPLMIQPSQVSADGRYSTTRGITGVQAGGWGSTATVVTDRFDVCITDDSNRRSAIRWNTFTGDYLFPPPVPLNPPGPVAAGETGSVSPGGTGLSGTGKMVMKGCIITLTHNAPDRRVFAKLDSCNKTGEASVQLTSPGTKFTITDKNIADNACSAK